jgi:hypothetical protein
MAYVYKEVRTLHLQPKVGKGDCVELIQRYVKVGSTITWRQGKQVFGNRMLLPGTAIATFVNGRYPNRPTGNHAAFYIGQQSGGIYVLDQWKGADKPKISIRFLDTKRLDYKSLSDNPYAFYVIE